MHVSSIVKWKLKGSAISQLIIIHAEVVSEDPGRRSSRLISTAHTTLLLHPCSDERLPLGTAGASEWAWSPAGMSSFKVHSRATQTVDEGKCLCVEIVQVITVEGMTELETDLLIKP